MMESKEQAYLLAESKGIELEVTGHALALKGVEEGDGAENLEEGNPEEDLSHGASGNELVVEGSHLSAGSNLGEGGVDGNVLENGASSGKHSNACISTCTTYVRIGMRHLTWPLNNDLCVGDGPRYNKINSAS